MGVCASGKTTFGKRLAERLGAEFIDGDDLHPDSNVRKMAAGQPLDDIDRQPWLDAIRDTLTQKSRESRSIVIACSALKKAYRDQLRHGQPGLSFAFLDVGEAAVLERIRSRSGHFMKDGMVASQFSVLEKPLGEEDTVTLDGEKSVDSLVDEFLETAGMF